MSFEMPYWREPLWLLMIFVPVIIILLVKYRQKKIWQQLADPDLLPWVQASPNLSRRFSSQFPGCIFLAIAWIFLSIALAGPRTPQWIPPSLQADINVVAVIDFSRSMKARDDKYDRIVQAQMLLKSWLKDVPANLRMGLVIYAGHSHTLLKPTNDQALLQHYIDQLHQFRPPTLGNNLAASLLTASELLKDSQGQRTILLLSDGDLGETSAHAAENIAEQIKAENLIKVNVIGVGKSEAVRVPLTMTEPLIVNGKSIVSSRQSVWLKSFSIKSGGLYQNAESVAELNLKQALHLVKSRIDPEHNHQIVWNEWFFIPLLWGLLFCLLSLKTAASVPAKLITSALFLSLGGCQLSEHSNEVKALYSALDAGDYAKVRLLSEKNNRYEARFSEGVACYRLKEYACALQAFSNAAWRASNDILRGRAVFNLANTHYRLGDYEQASVLFKDAELLGVAQRKTQINREFSDVLAASVQRRIAEIAKNRQRAQWREAARKLPEFIDELIADSTHSSQSLTNMRLFSQLSVSQQNALIAQGIKRKQARHKNNRLLSEEFWVKSKQNNLPQQTAALFNSLMPIEIGIHYVPEKPIAVKGQRLW
ncbi:MAG: VWA domain-containing protein [gamma proteobacterium symbiont of Bathyaustriella thionipta]|nr:VWA domain-containing protein [gamma proteobacterium symbiont of Bathyaustriella thionipta]MCU7949859.1 VWA domain-containing protein [gamma proteobacterium symbiont of Bathyaustriella thionipta]MCU7954939.1 VWA domain-containing protein [gamma proteobacterium symbiont of Bathyaustriella thionipta]MCU7956444.1 VWA domain-containing protein [gamma proteobacterium symbiont of Bathyaustriella thionipta]MCU7966915.1 VWA domain-containing protein [gamma proteobacterium symbiont of Bathyaustriella